jgi:two-component system, OmpR family, sensor kinase
MSLRLRLTLIYTLLLSGVVVLLSIVVYSMVSYLLLDFVDHFLEDGATMIIESIQLDGIGNLEFGSQPLSIVDDFFFQIWTQDGQLIDYSANVREFEQALDQEALGQFQARFNDVSIAKEPFRVLTVPLEVEGQEYGWLQVGVTLHRIGETLRLLQVVFAITVVYSIAVSAMIGWIVTGQALAPLERIAEITKQIASTDDLSKRIPVTAGQSTEINALTLTFNQTIVRLERLLDAQRRFLADVSHELRTPLTVIKGNVGLMRLTNALDEESLDSIEKEVNRLTRLVEDLLLMAQAEAGKLPLMLVAVRIDELMVEVFEEIKVLSAGRHDIQIDDLAPAVIHADRDRFKQVLLNLGSNAINYSPEGGRIALSLTECRDWVAVGVRDEGRGIPKEEINQLFERFYRGEKSRTRNSETAGFGLGLPIAYWIVRNHGGRIDVETQEGVGTIFTVWMPKTPMDIPTQPLQKQRQKKNDSETPLA